MGAGCAVVDAPGAAVAMETLRCTSRGRRRMAAPTNVYGRGRRGGDAALFEEWAAPGASASTRARGKRLMRRWRWRNKEAEVLRQSCELKSILTQ